MKKDIEKLSGSGITIDGDKTLEEVVAEEEAKEMAEETKPDPIHLKHKSRLVKYPDKKEPDGPGRVLTRREINKENWEKEIMSAKTIDEAIIAVLLSGEEIGGKAIHKGVVNGGHNLTRKQIQQRLSHLIHKTAFGKLIKTRREGKGRMFGLVSAALDLRKEELAMLAIKSNVKKVLEHHLELKPYFVDEEEKTNGLPDTSTKTPMPSVKEPKEGLDKGMTTQPDPLMRRIEEAISQSMGINVNVSGKIEIIFKFG